MRHPQLTGSRPPLLAVAHGSADPRAAAANRRLLARVAALLPDVPVRLAFLDHGAPTVPVALAQLAAEGAAAVAVQPLLLTVGYHSRVDIPALLHSPPVRVRYGQVLGPDPLLVEALLGRLAEAEVPDAAPVVVAVAGSSDPDARHDVERMAGLLAASRGGPVLPAYASAIGPTVVDAVAAAGPGAAVAAYFLAPGRLPDRVVEQAGRAVLTQPLDDAPAVARLLVDRWRRLTSEPAL